MIDVIDGAAHDDGRNRLHAGGLGFGQTLRRLAQMNHLDLIGRRIQRADEALLGVDADGAACVIENGFLGYDPIPCF